jgi:hypothetical protein
MPARVRPLLAILAVLLGAAACGAGSDGTSAASVSPRVQAAWADDDSVTLVVHRTPSCGCCGGWQDHVAQEGYRVDERHHHDLADLKMDRQIPQDEWSCHTTEVDGYFIEGHVPAQAIDDLLASRPDIDGITLGGMPPGSPGMPGPREAPFEVMAVVDGDVVGLFGKY